MAMIYTGTTISFQYNGKFQMAHNSHPKFNEIVECAKEGKLAEASRLIDIREVVSSVLKGTEAKLIGSKVYYKGEEVRGILAHRIVDLANQGFDAKPLLLFLENLMQNPSKRAVDELYGFLEASKLPITDDGHFLAYKSVRGDYKDHHSGTFDNSVGSICEMPRNSVDEDKDRTCSHGLHFAAHEYAEGFGRGGRMVVLKINPRDVVAIPSDYNNQKGRCCRYEVVEEVERFDKKLVDVGFVTTVPVRKQYVPQVDNYEDTSVWKMKQFVAKEASQFPVSRDVPYVLSRINPSKCYHGVFFFKTYDEDNDNLVFARFDHEGQIDRWLTVSNVDDWLIEVAEGY